MGKQKSKSKNKAKPPDTTDSASFVKVLAGVFKPRSNGQTTKARKSELLALRAVLVLWKDWSGGSECRKEISKWSPQKDPRKDQNGREISRTANKVGDMIVEASSKVEAMIEEIEQQEKDEASFAVTKMAPGKGQRCGDGKCYVTMVNMGSGDCTLVSSPLGVRFMIDMGSDALADVIGPYSDAEGEDAAAEKKVLDSIQSDRFLGASGNAIHFVILTHPDSDHYNKLRWLPRGVQFGCVYFSSSSIGEYRCGNATTTIRTATNSNSEKILKTKPITIRREKMRTLTRTVDGAEPPSEPIKCDPKAKPPKIWGNEYISPETGAIVLYDEKDTKFKVSVLAGNVTGALVSPGKGSPRWVTSDSDIKTDTREMKLKREGDAKNKGSLVILVECADTKVLITGDATAVTENFLVNEYGVTILSKVTHVRMGHHGSPTSSCCRFTDALKKLDTAVASSGGKETRLHRLPKFETLQLFPAKKGTLHQIYAFPIDKESGGSDPFKETRNIFTTGFNGNYLMAIPKS